MIGLTIEAKIGVGFQTAKMSGSPLRTRPQALKLIEINTNLPSEEVAMAVLRRRRAQNPEKNR